MKIIKIENNEFSLNTSKEIPAKAKIIPYFSEEQLSRKMMIYYVYITFFEIILGLIKKLVFHVSIITVNTITDLLGFTLIPILLFLLFIPIHEFLHIVIYPLDSTVYFGVLKQTGGFFVVSETKLIKSRFILMSLSPCLFLIFFVHLPVLFHVFHNSLIGNSFFFFGYFSMLACSGDLFNAIYIYRNVPNKSFIQNFGNDTYYYSNCENM